MTSLDAWLEDRLAEAPASLRDRIRRASTAAGESGALASRLREVAEELLASARRGPPNRDTAMTLLASDALITFAMEAEAEA